MNFLVVEEQGSAVTEHYLHAVADLTSHDLPEHACFTQVIPQQYFLNWPGKLPYLE